MAAEEWALENGQDTAYERTNLPRVSALLGATHLCLKALRSCPPEAVAAGVDHLEDILSCLLLALG